MWGPIDCMTNATLSHQREFRTLVDALEGVAIWTATEPGEFTYISAGFEDIWGISPEAVKDDIDVLFETIHPEDRERVISNIAASEEGLQDESYEGRIVRDDGSIRWVLVRQVLLYDDAGEVDEVIGICTDITDQKRREQELEMLNRMIRHDIRNDISVVMGWATMLEDHVDESGQEYLDKMLASGEHIVETTEMARDYADMVASDETLTLEPIPLGSVLETELSLREETYPDTEFVVEDSIPAVEVLANRMLSSVFRNLLNNAVQHNDNATPTVTVSFDVSEDSVVVRIADNGSGIPDAQKKSIFGKGDRGVESSGSGMGLFLVASLVGEYNGDVWVEDNDPTGSVFVVELPRAT